MRITIRRMMVIVAGIAGALWLLDSCFWAMYDGYYDLAVRVRSASKAQIRAASCQAFGDEALATEYLLKLRAPRDSLEGDSADPFTGQEMHVRVWFSERVSHSGRLLRDVQGRRYLLVIVKYGDGRRTGKVVPIPHRDVTKTVRVEFP
jgi:hypothetical protein